MLPLGVAVATVGLQLIDAPEPPFACAAVCWDVSCRGDVCRGWLPSSQQPTDLVLVFDLELCGALSDAQWPVPLQTSSRSCAFAGLEDVP